MVARPSTRAAPPRLRLISCRGVAAEAFLVLNGAASSLDAISELSPMAVPEETRAALRQCQMQPVAGPAGTQWWLHNRGCELHCTVNAQRIGAGEGLPLQHGDVIELGLVQICYQAHAAGPRPAGATAFPPALAVAETAAAGGAPAPAEPAFQLTDLGRLAPLPAWQPHAQPAVVDPFADIRDAMDGRNTSPSSGLARPSAELLQEAPAGEAAPAQATASAGVMDGLHSQYLRLMQNPNDPQMAGRWDVRETTAGPLAPSFDVLMQQTRDRDLYDILGHSSAIDPILERLDTLSTLDILQAPAPVDVLRLFAPPSLSGAETELPGLSRGRCCVLLTARA